MLRIWTIEFHTCYASLTIEACVCYVSEARACYVSERKKLTHVTYLSGRSSLVLRLGSDKSSRVLQVMISILLKWSLAANIRKIVLLKSTFQLCFNNLEVSSYQISHPVFSSSHRFVGGLSSYLSAYMLTGGVVCSCVFNNPRSLPSKFSTQFSGLLTALLVV